jgi:replicative DNA helicase
MISGEQSRAQMGMRLMAIDGRVGLHRMRKGTLEDMDWARLNNAMDRLRKLPMWMNDKPSPTIQEVRRQAAAWKYEHNIKLLMVDYLQKISGGAGSNRAEQIGDVASELKNIAREFEISVVALAQVNRAVEANPLGSDGMGRMPFMNDIRESGVVEAEADIVITGYRPAVYLPDDQRFKDLAIFNVCKSRHGPIGFIECSWQGEYLKFGDLAETERD